MDGIREGAMLKEVERVLRLPAKERDGRLEEVRRIYGLEVIDGRDPCYVWEMLRDRGEVEDSYTAWLDSGNRRVGCFVDCKDKRVYMRKFNRREISSILFYL